MKIEFGFDIESLNNAIKKLNKFKDEFPALLSTYAWLCCKEVKLIAEKYIDRADIGERVKSEIKQSYDYKRGYKSCKLVYNSDKAVWVEFGTGLVGSKTPHKNAANTNYEYNIKPAKKDKNDVYRFRIDDINSLDISLYGAETKVSTTKSGGLLIATKGESPVQFLYNAAMEFINSGDYKRVWYELIKSY